MELLRKFFFFSYLKRMSMRFFLKIVMVCLQKKKILKTSFFYARLDCHNEFRQLLCCLTVVSFLTFVTYQIKLLMRHQSIYQLCGENF